MADKRITQLNLHTSLELSDSIAIVNSGETKKTTYGSLKEGIRDGLVSGSSQIDITQTQNYGNVMITGSLSDGTITFTKGDSSTFDIDLGSVFTKHAWLSCYSTSSQQLISSGSAQPVTFTSIWTQEGVSLVSGSQITFAEAGTYEFNFVAQVENSSNTTYDAYFWVKYNGENFANSTTQMTMRPRKSSGLPNAQLMNVSIIGVALNDNDYIELYWTGESTQLSLAETPAFNGVPETPSIIASIKRIG